MRYAAQISGVHPGEMDRRKSSGNDGDLWSVAWKQREIPGSFIGNNDMRSHGISVPEHTAGRRIAGDHENLLKCLNFLGNYSLTAGEITMVLGQVSRYVEEPLKGALEECAYEAQTTGDSSLALLSMAERIEHPKIKELARNLEISIRYMADLTTLVDSSRRSAREYLRMEEERKGMLREAGINMAVLLGMSVFALLTVDRLIDVSVWKIVSGTLPGHLAVGVYGLILFLFLRKLYGFRR